MTYENVDVIIKDQFDRPVEAVIVRVFNPDGSVFFTQQTTDADGKASFLLYTQQYSMRFYKFQATFPQPQMLEVLEAPAVNVFDVAAEVFVPPISSDARLCRCSGYFRDPDGSVQEYLDLQFYPDFSPIVMDSAGVVPRKASIRTDANGFAQIDLIRGACYRVTIEGMEHEERFIRVPDTSSANLPDVLYAVVKRVVFSPPGPWTLNTGEELDITPTVYDSAGAVLTGTAQADVTWRTSDMSVVGLSIKETVLTLRAIAPGSANLTAERTDQSIIVIPNTPVEGQPVGITVL